MKQRKASFATLLPASTRAVIIIHLCLVFAFLSCKSAEPFVADYFRAKSMVTLYSSVIGDLTSSSSRDVRGAERFRELPEELRTKILTNQLELTQEPPLSFVQKVGVVLKLLGTGIPPFVQAWLFFSLILCFLLLLRIEGAAHAAWLLPLIVIAYGISSFFHPTPIQEQENAFPVENIQSLSKEQLLNEWRLYLVRSWAKEEPSVDSGEFSLQVERGEYAFNLGILEKQMKTKGLPEVPQEGLSLFVFGIYLTWNGFLAWFVNRKRAFDLIQAAR